MDLIEEYRGFRIIAHSGQTGSGKCFGTYEVIPATKQAEDLMDEKAIKYWACMETTSDDRAMNPRMLNHKHLLERARREIDRFIDSVIK